MLRTLGPDNRFFGYVRESAARKRRSVARRLVNLLGQDLEGDDVVSGVNLVREVDLP
jgi:hypothetical protein